MFNLSYQRRCGCQEPVVGDDSTPILNGDGTPKLRKLGASCPKLSQKGHGTWYFYFEYFELEAGEGGKRRRVRRGGFATRDEAKAKAAEVYREVIGGADVLTMTTAPGGIADTGAYLYHLATGTLDRHQDGCNTDCLYDTALRALGDDANISVTGQHHAAELTRTVRSRAARRWPVRVRRAVDDVVWRLR